MAFALTLAVSASVSVASFLQHWRTAATLSLVHEGYLPLALTVSEVRATQSVFGNLLERMLSARNLNATRIWLNAARRARPNTLEQAIDSVEAIEHMAPPAADREALRRLKRDLRGIKTMMTRGEERYDDLYGALDAGDRDAAERVLADLRVRERAIDGRLRTVWATNLRRIEETSERAAAEQDAALAVLLALVVVALMVGVAVTWWSSRVLSPLPALQERVEAVARGDFAQRLGPNTDDEIGRLGREFERMVAALAARDASLKELQRMQAQILADLSAAVLVTDAEGILRSVNPAARRLFALPDDALGSALGSTDLGVRIDGLETAIARVVEGAEREVLGEVGLLPPASQLGDGRRYLDVVVTPFGSEAVVAGRGGVLVVAEDITDALNTKARLIQSERLAAIGRMAAHVTHEVRNPLSSMGLNMELLQDELHGAGGEARELLTAIQREIEHLTAVTEEYLRVARLPNPQLEPEQLGDIVHSAVEFLRPELSAAGLDLDVDVQPELPMVALDETQIRQVLINLIKNAREACVRGGVVRVRVGELEGAVVVRVSDDGKGMTEEERARIFDLFYTTKETGTGLGLPLSQQIVVAHGGLIRCQSAEGEGTEFELLFPACQGGGGPVASLEQVREREMKGDENGTEGDYQPQPSATATHS